ncbi:hypothetical protein F8M41_012066 [Gigaspora margarita]|uniref:Uncharacterized protein n=1 Tax=Gigaspora margarita TaxID=4874 RepID=A0A8H3X1B9_GIGMA|nr:hypothetical protein F8M41_012066 [Gigaspora margarita]
MKLVGKELYIFQKIAECSLPARAQNCDILYKVIITLVKLRILSDKIFVIYDSLQQSRSTPPPQHIKLTRDMGVSPHSIIKQKTQNKNKSKKEKNEIKFKSMV